MIAGDHALSSIDRDDMSIALESRLISHHTAYANFPEVALRIDAGHAAGITGRNALAAGISTGSAGAFS